MGEKGPSGKITDDVVDISQLDCGTKFLAISNSSPLSSSYLFPLLSLHSFLPTLHFFPPSFRLLSLPNPPIIIAIPPFMSFCVLFLLLGHFLLLLPLIFLYFPLLLLPFLSPVFSFPSFFPLFPHHPIFSLIFPHHSIFSPSPFSPPSHWQRYGVP